MEIVKVTEGEFGRVDFWEIEGEEWKWKVIEGSKYFII